MFTMSEECIHSQSNQFDFIWLATDNVNFKVLYHNKHKEIKQSINNLNNTSWQRYPTAKRWADASRSYLRFLFISFWWRWKLLIKHEFLYTIKSSFLLSIIRKVDLEFINYVITVLIQYVLACKSNNLYTNFRYLVTTKDIKRIIKNIMACFRCQVAFLDRRLRLLCRWGYWFCNSRWENIICKQQKE